MPVRKPEDDIPYREHGDNEPSRSNAGRQNESQPRQNQQSNDHLRRMSRAALLQRRKRARVADQQQRNGMQICMVAPWSLHEADITAVSDKPNSAKKI